MHRKQPKKGGKKIGKIREKLMKLSQIICQQNKSMRLIQNYLKITRSSLITSTQIKYEASFLQS